MPAPLACLFAMAALFTATAAPAVEPAEVWRFEWSRTDFTRKAVPLGEVRSPGPARDAIPAIDTPQFRPATLVADIADDEPVVGLVVGGMARAYPLRILHWHEIVNDELGGVPVAVTYSPLTNAAIVYDRRHDGRTSSFGVTGKLRHANLLMYDRTTESWWQQFTGQAIIGELIGARLRPLPARLESLAEFRARAPQGEVLMPPLPGLRPYGTQPYTGYDSGAAPLRYDGPQPPPGVPAMARVVAVGNRAWTLDLLAARGRVGDGDLLLQWQPGQRSALDSQRIDRGGDVGTAIVQRRGGEGWSDVPYTVVFAFAFHAFTERGELHTADGMLRW